MKTPELLPIVPPHEVDSLEFPKGTIAKHKAIRATLALNGVEQVPALPPIYGKGTYKRAMKRHFEKIVGVEEPESDLLSVNSTGEQNGTDI